MRVGLILAFVVATVLLAGIWWNGRPKENAPELANTHPATLDERVPAALQRGIRNAARVEAVLVSHDMSMLSERADGRHIWAYRPRSEPVTLRDDHRRSLTALLLDRTSYLRNKSNTCTFEPNVAYRFESPVDTTDVLVCHYCDEVVFWNGSETRPGNIRPAGGQFEAISHALFPDDSTVTAEWKKGLK